MRWLLGLMIILSVSPLVQAEPPRLVPALIDGLGDPDVEVRLNLATALAHLGKEALPALDLALSDGSSARRAGAAYALGLMGGSASGSLPGLVRLLKDPDLTVRRQAALAVNRIVAAGGRLPGRREPLPPDPDPVPTAPRPSGAGS